VRPSAVLVAVIASAAVVGIAISAAQRPPSATPSPTHAPTPRPEPTAIPSAPVTGIGFTVADDPATGQVVLFGGVGDGANTWLWVAGHWVLARPPTSPPGRIDASAAYDPETEQVLLFGGGDARVNGSPSFDDTWAWDGYTWTELERLSHGEPIGEGSSMAWDDALDEMVLVTSADDTSGNDETWVWSGSGWVLQVQGDVAPSAFDLAMAFDPVTRSLIAEGCCATPQSPLGALDTTWRWNGRRWIQLAGTAEPLPGSSLALDPSTGHLALCNCGPMLALPALASWTGTKWALMNVARLPIEPEAVITDAGTGQLVLVGSATPSSPFVAQPVHLWSLVGTAWRELDAPVN